VTVKGRWRRGTHGRKESADTDDGSLEDRRPEPGVLLIQRRNGRFGGNVKAFLVDEGRGRRVFRRHFCRGKGRAEIGDG
jgi:hypothetical protein